MENHFGGTGIGYVSNGAFIQAAINKGYEFQKLDINAVFKIKFTTKGKNQILNRNS